MRLARALALVFALCAALPVQAATANRTYTGIAADPGDACALSNAVDINGDTTLVCNGSAWLLGTTFSAGGNLGIGTADPKAKLHVAGEAIIGNTSLACDADAEGAALEWHRQNRRDVRRHQLAQDYRLGRCRALPASLGQRVFCRHGWNLGR